MFDTIPIDCPNSMATIESASRPTEDWISACIVASTQAEAHAVFTNWSLFGPQRQGAVDAIEPNESTDSGARIS